VPSGDEDGCSGVPQAEELARRKQQELDAWEKVRCMAGFQP
jgi:hypothetical protein